MIYTFQHPTKSIKVTITTEKDDLENAYELLASILFPVGSNKEENMKFIKENWKLEIA